MPRPTVHLESSVISYLAARPSRDAIVAGHQEATHRWWATRREQFDLFTSQLVIDEIAAGDPAAAAARTRFIKDVPVLTASSRAVQLAQNLLRSSGLPPKALADAVHVAVAASNGMEFLLTWNLRHIANAHIRPRLESTCHASGWEPPTICTPDELLGEPANEL